MTREEAIKRLKEDAPFSELYNEQWEEALDMAIKALEDSRWIPVTERLPDREGAYIVTVMDIFGNGYVTREWFYGNEWSYSYVVAWMDVKAYEGSKEDAEKL